jgi:lysophospholipase
MDDLLFDSPDNPRPDNARSGWLDATDGVRLRYATFGTTAAPRRGTVVIVTGRNECIEKYFETARDLAGRGLGSAMMDLRGQGASQRLLKHSLCGYVGSFDDYVRDLDRFFTEVVLPDCRPPYYLLGHSTGALIALLATPMLANRITRMVLVSPFLSVIGLPLSMTGVRRLSGFMRAIGAGRLCAYGGTRPDLDPPFATSKVTSDPTRFRRNIGIYRAHPQLALAGPTYAWVYGACTTSQRIQRQDYIDRIAIPVLMVAAGADEVVSTRAVETYARRLKNGSVLTVDGARHEILQEQDIYREQLLAAFDAFVPGAEPATV